MKKAILITALALYFLSFTEKPKEIRQTTIEIVYTSILCIGTHDDGRTRKLIIENGKRYVVNYDRFGRESSRNESTKTEREFGLDCSRDGFASAC